MAVFNRELLPSELNDAARLIWLAKGIGAHSLDDIERLGRMRGVRLIPVLKRDLLDEVRRVIESEAKGRADFGGDGG